MYDHVPRISVVVTRGKGLFQILNIEKKKIYNLKFWIMDKPNTEYTFHELPSMIRS